LSVKPNFKKARGSGFPYCRYWENKERRTETVTDICPADPPDKNSHRFARSACFSAGQE